MILRTVTLITLNSLGSTTCPPAEQNLDLAQRKAGDGRIHQQQTFHNSTKTRERINCDAHRSGSTAHSQRDKPAHSICLETGTANSKLDSTGQQDILSWNTFLYCISTKIQVGDAKKGNIDMNKNCKGKYGTL